MSIVRQMTHALGRAFIVALCMTLVLGTTVAAPPAEARSVTYDLNIPSQDLDAALQQLALASKHKLLYRSDLVAGKRSAALKGSFTTEEALTAVLAGTGLTFEITPSAVVLVREIETDKAGGSLKESGPPAVAPHSSQGTGAAGDGGSRGLWLTQVDQGQTSSPSTVEKKDEQASKKKPVQLEEVVVTGTHIAGEAPVGTPVHTLDREEIDRSGYTTTQQLLQSLPENFRGGAAGASEDSNFSAGSNAGLNVSHGSGVNLRGIGADATLVLVNGHRVAPSGSGFFTDISTIPVSAIDHIDVLTDGASAIYGSDAIGGVVNIVLKDSSEGVQTGFRLGRTSDGGANSVGANAELGHRWASGGFTFGSDYVNQSRLDASQRSFTSSVISPTSIVPAYDQIALTGAAHQDFGDRLKIHGDAQYSHKTLADITSSPGMTFLQLPTTERWSGSAGARYRLSESWTVQYDVSGGQERNSYTQFQGGVGNPTNYFGKQHEELRVLDQEATASGSALRLPAGDVTVAIGASYRTEHYSQVVVLAPPIVTSARRDVSAEYGEMHIPVFSAENAVSGLANLALSAAVRHERYSDFGDTTNTKYGISWFPTRDLEFRGARSTSFRAPSTGQELSLGQQGLTTTFLLGAPGPAGSPPVPVLFLEGAIPNLKPETATNITLGSTYKPHFLPGLSLSVNYYNIDYTGQIANPPGSPDPLNDPAFSSVVTRYPSSAPIQAIVASGIQMGAPFFDFTFGAFGPNPLANTVYLFDQREANLSSTKTSGLDFNASYSNSVGANQLDTLVGATYIDKFKVRIVPTSPPISQVNTVGSPARVRLRAQEAWTRGDLNLNVALNFVDSYADTSALTPRQVAAFATVDMAVRYSLSNGSLPRLGGLVVAFAVVNLFDRAPPYVAAPPNVLGVASHYDPANASPLGRMINLSLTKSW